MTNPVAVTCQKVGLSTPTAVAKLLGIDRNDAVDLLSDHPPKQVQYALRLLAECGAILKLPMRPFSFWLDRQHLDTLYDNNDFRDDVGMTRYPRTRGELADEVRRLRDLGHSYDTIATSFNLNHIPRINQRGGGRGYGSGEVFPWTVANTNIDSQKGPKSRPILPSDAYMKKWRGVVVELILANCCPHSPGASVLWSMDWREEGGRVIVASPSMPDGPRRWTGDWLAGRKWLEGHWGLLSAEDS